MLTVHTVGHYINSTTHTFTVLGCSIYIPPPSSDTVTPSTPHTTYTPSLPSPPPGFVAKPAFATTSVTSVTRPAVTKVATPTTVHGAVGGGTLSNSVNHALWASSQIQGSQMQGKGMYTCVCTCIIHILLSRLQACNKSHIVPSFCVILFYYTVA